MGKNDFLTPKAIANRIKSKGLQKLRWYCQLCQKQCRDENGFKCHQTSEGHRRQMEVFGENPGRVIGGYSEEFEEYFMAHLRQAHPHSRVSAKVVYNEFIADRNHIHMNATRWLTLTEFVKYLGREGKCKVEETPKGWFITLIHTDGAKALEEQERARREARDLDDEERQRRLLEYQVERARKRAKLEGGQAAADEEDPGVAELKRGEEDGPIKLSLAAGGGGGAAGAAAAGGVSSSREAAAAVGVSGGGRPRPAVAPAPLFEEDEEDGPGPSGKAGGPSAPPRKLSKVEELMQKDLARKQHQQQQQQPSAGQGQRRDKEGGSSAAGGGGSGGGRLASSSGRLDHWLAEGVVVKVLSKALQEHGYYKAKGVVSRVIDKYVGELTMVDSGDVIRVDQEELETVLPAPGGKVLVVNGQYRGARGVLEGLDVKRYQADVEIVSKGPWAGQRVWFDYEDVCKLASK